MTEGFASEEMSVCAAFESCFCHESRRQGAVWAFTPPRWRRWNQIIVQGPRQGVNGADVRECTKMVAMIQSGSTCPVITITMREIRNAFATLIRVRAPSSSRWEAFSEVR